MKFGTAFVAVFGLAAGLLAASGARSEVTLLGDEASYVDLGAGAFNLLSTHGKTPTSEGTLEFHYGDKLWGLGPAAGVLVNGQGGVFGYGGIYADFARGPWLFTPLLAVGGYSRGDSEELGGVFEFRLSATLAYRFAGGARLGLEFGHISNAGIHSTNPSDNEALVSLALPLGPGTR